jgi:hypothetical protein
MWSRTFGVDVVMGSEAVTVESANVEDLEID